MDKQNNIQIPNPGAWGMMALNQLNDILKAFDDGVFVVAADIPEHQLAEIRREMAVMLHTVAAGYKEAGLPTPDVIPGSAHFKRGA